MSQTLPDMRQQRGPPHAMMWIGFFVLVGFALRCLAARGGLWTDEAWSLIYAQHAGDALGVLTRINHDNNHHLNSLWLQFVGPEAPPILMRGLSIISSSATIAIAALIGLKRGQTVGVITAALFALSPIMVIYGSEARGYAAMMFALMIMIWRIDIWLDNQSAARPALLLAFCALIGSFSHLMMPLAVAMLWLWVFFACIGRGGMPGAFKIAADLLGPAIAVSVTSLSAVILIAAHSETGIQIGGYTPFSWPLFLLAISNIATFTAGIGYAWDLSFVMIAAIAAIGAAMHLTRLQIPAERKYFYAALILTMPVAVAAFGVGNSQYARYYLPAAAAILLLLAEWIGQLMLRQGRMRIGTTAFLVLMLGLASLQNYQLILSQRGQPGRAVEIISQFAPQGADVTITTERASATLKVAAAGLGYPLIISRSKCSSANFHFITGVTRKSAPYEMRSCAGLMRLIAFGTIIGPSGESWSLYQRQALPRRIAAVSSALPRQ